MDENDRKIIIERMKEENILDSILSNSRFKNAILDLKHGTISSCTFEQKIVSLHKFHNGLEYRIDIFVTVDVVFKNGNFKITNPISKKITGCISFNRDSLVHKVYHALNNDFIKLDRIHFKSLDALLNYEQFESKGRYETERRINKDIVKLINKKQEIDKVIEEYDNYIDLQKKE